MKTTKFHFIIALCFFIPSHVLAQNKCKVLMPEIDSVYEGKCKKGLAHGFGLAKGTDTYQGKFKRGWPEGVGTYTWSTGEEYEGNFLKGIREGEGIYRFFVNGNDTMLSGLWKNDAFIGPVPLKPKVRQQVSIDRYNIKKISSAQQRVLIYFSQNGGRNAQITDLLIAADSGYEFALGNSKGFKEMTFPVTMMVKYTTPNKLKTRPVYCIFEFTIFEPGDWLVELFN